MGTMNWVTVVVFWQRPQNVHGNQFGETTGREMFQVALPLKASLGHRAFKAAPDCLLDGVGKIWQVQLTCRNAVHAMIPTVSSQLHIMCQVE